jgi:2-aminobenzoate-CoA ligase
MFDNVSSEYVHDVRPQLTYPNDRIDYVYNTSTLNATEAILGSDDWGERDAVVDLGAGESLTYDDLRARVDAFAGALRDLGVEPGDRVLWRFDESVTAQVVQLATWKVGGIAVPSVLQERSRELEYYLRDTEARVVVVTDEEFDHLESALESVSTVEEVVVAGSDARGHHSYDDMVSETEPSPSVEPTAPFDVASIYYTGGTTGRPKGCIYSHAREVAIADLECGDMGRDLQPGDVVFSPAPMGHGFGNGEKINFPFRFGATVLLGNELGPAAMLECIQEYDVRVFAAVPTLLRMMLNQTDVANYDLSSLDLVFVAGETLDERRSSAGATPPGSA